MKSFVCVILLCLFIGCSKLSVSPQDIKGYSHGVAIMQQNDGSNKLQLEMAQTIIGGLDKVPLLVFITIESLRDEYILIDTNNVSLHIGDRIILPISFYDLINANVDFTLALYDYGIAVTDDAPIKDHFFNNVAYGNISYPVLFSNALLFSYGFGKNYFFLKRAFPIADRYKNAREKLAMRYLRKNTLTKDNPEGGFIAFSYADIKRALKNNAVSKLVLVVHVGDKTYSFDITLKNTKK